MTVPENYSPSRPVLTRTLLGVFLSALAFPSLARQSGTGNPELAKIKSLAASQHEIVMILLEKKDYAKASAEAAKIFEMKWPADQEPILLKELLFFTDQFRHKDQAIHGLQLIESSAKAFKTPASLVSIWKEKGYLYKGVKQMDKALDCFREAQRLEKSPP